MRANTTFTTASFALSVVVAPFPQFSVHGGGGHVSGGQGGVPVSPASTGTDRAITSRAGVMNFRMDLSPFNSLMDTT